MTTIIFIIAFLVWEQKYSSECLQLRTQNANTLQNYPELYKMENAKT